MSADVLARSVSPADGGDRVRALQRVLYRCAKQGQDRRFHALHDKVARSDVLWRAWGEVRVNRGAPGVDGITIEDVLGSGVGEFLEELASKLRAGTYRPRPLRRVRIPKPGRPGQLRPLGIPCVADRVVMAAAKAVLEPIFEADFLPTSYGFRPGLSAHHALEAVRRTATWRGKAWVLDADIRSCLESSSHCLRVHGGGVEQAGFGVWDQYSQAFSASVADVEGLQLAALDTLQHGLAGDAEDPHRVDDRDVAGWCVFDEQRAELVVDADSPGAPGVSCSPRMKPAWSQRKMVEAAMPSSSAALPTGSSSPSSPTRWPGRETERGRKRSGPGCNRDTCGSWFLRDAGRSFSPAWFASLRGGGVRIVGLDKKEV